MEILLSSHYVQTVQLVEKTEYSSVTKTHLIKTVSMHQRTIEITVDGETYACLRSVYHPHCHHKILLTLGKLASVSVLLVALVHVASLFAFLFLFEFLYFACPYRFILC